MPVTLQDPIAHLKAHRPLSEHEAESVIGLLMRGEAADAEIAELLTAWKDKGVTVDELVGAARAMRGLAAPIRVKPGIVADTCGTGGDGLDTFNISTVAAFIVAGAGVRVAKHGNRGATSRCGSADLLEALGVNVDPGSEVVARCIDEIGFGFLFAPRFHPAMKHVAPVRKALGFRTVFNLLGPLTNPAGATYQLVGVSAPDLQDLMAQALGRLGARRALVVHGAPGLDEVSTVGETRVVEVAGGKTMVSTLTPESLGVARVPLESLRGGDPAACAQIARDVLGGKPGPYRDAAVLNAGCALYAAEAVADVAGGVALAQRALDSGRADEVLQHVKTWTNMPQ
ncbi:MAG: anthranilate phosphoribosyltransferase [Omnitrophica WOR_2 bacterium RIFCSPHIGHO2_02_FULL_68_15]|nr:MAG: anthranilate phosphoribosyltransferase [Omnitrophica WOR_2 bacterium RIFCSPHIGHO2_02_FULL_68_15]